MSVEYEPVLLVFLFGIGEEITTSDGRRGVVREQRWNGRERSYFIDFEGLKIWLDQIDLLAS